MHLLFYFKVSSFLMEQVEVFSTVLLTYLFLLFRTLPLIAQLNGGRSQLVNGSPSIAIANDFLRTDNKPFMKNGLIPFTSLKQGIHFQQVSLTYLTQTKPGFTAVDLYLPKNTTLALVGASGAGKSTLSDLLPRFYDPTEGCILIDGQDLREMEYHSLRRAMGIVSQDMFLFNTSIRENIAYGCPLVQEAIDNLSRDRTTLGIAHRLSTVQKADQIAVLDQGRVVELGTHKALMVKQGYYARLCEMQWHDEAPIKLELC